MENLIKLFKLIQITRTQPQYGYSSTGIKRHELSNLAEHHYLVSFIALSLAKRANQNGGNIDIAKVLEISLMHDLGELFGGDIAMPYAIANPEAKKHAKAFEAENLRFLNSFIEHEDFEWLKGEIFDPRTDEGIIAKLADYVEVTHYLFYMNKASDKHMKMILKKINILLDKVEDKKVKNFLKGFARSWAKNVAKGTFLVDELSYAN